MARIRRMITKGKRTVYHVISRTALPGFPVGDAEKNFFVNLLKRKAKLYFTEMLGFCIMGNHFHLLIRMLPGSEFSDQDIRKRIKHHSGRFHDISKDQIPWFRTKLECLSEFIKEVKQEFSRFYNKRHCRRGFFWGDRFRSRIVQDGYMVVNCLADIDLNPVRAGLVKKPEEYQWNSIGYHLQTKNSENLLSLDFGLDEFGVRRDKRLREYQRFLNKKG